MAFARAPAPRRVCRTRPARRDRPLARTASARRCLRLDGDTRALRGFETAPCQRAVCRRQDGSRRRASAQLNRRPQHDDAAVRAATWLARTEESTRSPAAGRYGWRSVCHACFTRSLCTSPITGPNIRCFSSSAYMTAAATMPPRIPLPIGLMRFSLAGRVTPVSETRRAWTAKRIRRAIDRTHLPGRLDSSAM